MELPDTTVSLKTTEKTQVIVIDPHTAVRSFFSTTFGAQRDREIVAEGRNGREALQLCHKFEPRLLILELELAEIGGATVVVELRARASKTRTLIYTASSREPALLDALRSRPHGFVHKDESLSSLWNAINTVESGGRFISPSFGALEEQATANESALQLTPRERAVLQMIAESYPNKAIGKQLGVAAKTIEHNRTSLMKKLGVHDIAALTRAAMRMGLVK